MIAKIALRVSPCINFDCLSATSFQHLDLQRRWGIPGQDLLIMSDLAVALSLHQALLPPSLFPLPGVGFPSAGLGRKLRAQRPCFPFFAKRH